MKQKLKLADFHKAILAAEAETDRGEVTSHEQLEKESTAGVKKATRRKNWAELRKIIRASIAQANRGKVISHKQAIKASKHWIKKTAK